MYQHDALKSFYEENDQIYPACLSDDQKQICLPLYDFLCSAGTVFDLTNVWPTYVFLVEVYNRQTTSLRNNVGHAPFYMQNKKIMIFKQTLLGNIFLCCLRNRT